MGPAAQRVLVGPAARPLWQRSPGLAEEDRERQQDQPECAKATLISMTSCFVIEVRRQALEDLVKLVGALGRVVLAAGRLGDRHQRDLVDRSPETATDAGSTAAAPAAAPEPPAARVVVRLAAR